LSYRQIARQRVKKIQEWLLFILIQYLLNGFFVFFIDEKIRVLFDMSGMVTQIFFVTNCLTNGMNEIIEVPETGDSTLFEEIVCYLN
jgi:hypothetical protein